VRSKRWRAAVAVPRARVRRDPGAVGAGLLWPGSGSAYVEAWRMKWPTSATHISLFRTSWRNRFALEKQHNGNSRWLGLYERRGRNCPRRHRLFPPASQV